GNWDFFLFYTPEAQQAEPLVFLPYLIPGQIVGHFISDTDPALTPALIVVFHLMNAGFDAVLVIVIYRFAAAFLDNPRDRVIATILALFGGGLGWLLALTGQSTLPADFYIPEGFTFLILFGLPHLALARAALLAGLLALMKSLPADKPIRPTGNELRWLIGAGICWLIVGLCVSFYLAVIYCVLGAWGLAAWAKDRRFPMALFVRAVMAAGITLPLFLFYALAFAANPAFALWSAQNILTSPPPLQYVFAYILLILMAAFGVRWLWTRAGLRPAPTDSVGSWAYNAAPLLIGWVLIVPILVYLPINVQRRMSEGVIVPLAVLAAAGLRVLAERRVPLVARGALIAVSLLTSVLLLLGGVLAAIHPATPLFRPAAEVDAFNWLDQHAPPDQIVLSAVETGNVLPAWTNLRTVMGHGPETLQWPEKTDELEAFYADKMSDPQRVHFLADPCAANFTCAGMVRYVMFGPLERALAPSDSPAWASGMSVVYDSGGYRIYATQP
ncbi:MAG TPA: hypothetical protein VHD90_19240, partial [Phototrophicaceae bacterium]|nr:hypothetical protein [Phototrophicaceae bacterium]